MLWLEIQNRKNQFIPVAVLLLNVVQQKQNNLPLRLDFTAMVILNYHT